MLPPALNFIFLGKHFTPQVFILQQMTLLSDTRTLKYNKQLKETNFMDKLKYKALALDLDGTLTDSEKRLPEENKKAIWKAIDAGVTIILASGRAPMGINYIAEELELDKRGGIIAALNGGKGIDCRTGEVIVNILLPHELIQDICDISAKHGAAPVSYTDTQVVSAHETEYVLKECKCNNTTLFKVDDLPEFLDYPINKLMISGENERLLKVQAEILAKHSDQMVSFFSESFFLEAAPLGVGKDLALARICEYLNISKEEVMVCGDGPNDVTMFDFSGFAVAMKNAYPEAVEHADVVVPKTNDECGVAYAIEKYILGE